MRLRPLAFATPTRHIGNASAAGSACSEGRRSCLFTRRCERKQFVLSPCKVRLMCRSAEMRTLKTSSWVSTQRLCYEMLGCRRPSPVQISRPPLWCWTTSARSCIMNKQNSRTTDGSAGSCTLAGGTLAGIRRAGLRGELTESHVLTVTLYLDASVFRSAGVHGSWRG
jgi:hypothetical protein